MVFTTSKYNYNTSWRQRERSRSCQWKLSGLYWYFSFHRVKQIRLFMMVMLEFIKNLFNEESFVYSSLWQLNNGGLLHIKNERKSWNLLLLLLSGDIETCPGPVKLTCLCCSKIIRKRQLIGICCICYNCCHLKCLNDKLVINKEKT